MYDLDRINKKCFWDYHFENSEILEIANSDDERRKKFFIF